MRSLIYTPAASPTATSSLRTSCWRTRCVKRRLFLFGFLIRLFRACLGKSSRPTEEIPFLKQGAMFSAGRSGIDQDCRLWLREDHEQAAEEQGRQAAHDDELRHTRVRRA
jgi:hypothetical protein